MHCSFFFLLLFKANGSENERSTMTPAEISDDSENRQMEKGCSRQAGVVAAHSPVLCHTGWSKEMLCAYAGDLRVRNHA